MEHPEDDPEVNEPPGTRGTPGTGASEQETEAGEQEGEEEVHEPAKLVRLSRMIHTSLEEIREGGLDERTRTHLGEVVDQIPDELTNSLSSDLREELERLRSGRGGQHTPTESELRIEQAQLVGWLQGVLGGIQTALSAEQAGAQAGLEQLGQGSPGEHPGGHPGIYG